MNWLAFNVGSSSLKYGIYSDNKPLIKGQIDNILNDNLREEALLTIIKGIKLNNIKIDYVVHRIVHGKDINKPVKINKNVISKLKKISELAPLHEIPEIKIVEKSMNYFKVPQFAVFDTSFFANMPLKAKVYALPYKYYKKGIKKYGFHGLSHKAMSSGLRGKTITCHLGNGCSISSINNGKCVDTSMGFTPMEGLVMSTRSGSIDPSIIPYLVSHEKKSLQKISDMLNFESGLLGISNYSYSMKKLLESNKKQCKLAVDVFIDRAIKQIGAYIALLKGVDNIVFSGGIGENNSLIRKLILQNFEYLGLKLDTKKNTSNNTLISDSKSKIKVYVKKANEEIEMIKEVKNSFPKIK